MKQEDNIDLIKQQPAPVTSAHKDNNGLDSPVVEHHQTSGDAKFSHVELVNPISPHVSYSPNTSNMEQDNTNLPVQKQGSSSAKVKEEDTQPPLGMPHYRSPYSERLRAIDSQAGGRLFDYEERYAPDPLGEEMRENARVFKVYLDEANDFDDDMLRGFRETIDSLLVFVQLLRAAGNSTTISTIPQSSVDLQNVSVDMNDLWVNGLFLASLSLALVTAFLSVLVKQWLQAYTSISAGNAKQRAIIRQFRYAGIVKWKVPEIVGILPLILHTSLALFLIGLSLYISVLHSSLSWVVCTVTSLAFTCYFSSVLLPQVWLECPYRIPLLFVSAQYIIYPFNILVWSFRWIAAKFHTQTEDFRENNSYPSFTQSSLRNAELQYLEDNDRKQLILADILIWLLSLESNQSIQKIVAQPVSSVLMHLPWTNPTKIYYTKLKNHATQVARALWDTLSKFEESKFRSSGLLFDWPFIELGQRGSGEVGELFFEGTKAYWDNIVSNNEPSIISKYFKYSDINLEWLGINDGWKNASLLKAVINDHFAMTKVLVENGADVNAQGGDFGSVLQAATNKGNLDIVRFLIERDANVNAQGGFFGNALQAPARYGNLDIVKYLVENDADINAEGGAYGNALQAAAFGTNFSIVKFLVEKGADVNAQGGAYRNALHAAAFAGSLDIVKYLVEHGADVKAQGLFGTALQAAEQQKWSSIADFLTTYAKNAP
ncbi:hypothetical protein HHX47_DHR2000181 [Lentinula edodes]|nr:hypothetical protein HHX47_DHR2000181 [Lentinula edodes]